MLKKSKNMKNLIIPKIDHIEINVWDQFGNHKRLDAHGLNIYLNSIRWLESIGY